MEIPIVDLNNKKISGARKGTFEYLHEKAHIDFNNSNLGMNINYFAQLSEQATVMFCAFGFFVPIFKWFSLVGVLFMLFFFIFEEIYCNYKAKERVNATMYRFNK